MQLAIVGDVHRAWDDFDIDWFNGSSGYDGVLFVGDLPRLKHSRAYGVASNLARLTLPAWLIPGNHDATSVGAMFAEIADRPVTSETAGRAQAEKVARLRAALHPIVMGGYSHHTIETADSALGLIMARPHAMGERVSFPAYIAHEFGVTSLDDSAARLGEVIDACPHERLVILAHNGPTGLGTEQHDIWGCDFRRQGGDFGDPDLETAIAHALRTGRQVLAVVAGHMHLTTKQGRDRVWRVQDAGVVYVNAARVPRIFTEDDQRWHHHVLLEIAGDRCVATQRLVAADGTVRDLAEDSGS